MEHGVIIMNTYQMVITGNYIPANSSGGTYTYTSVYIYICCRQSGKGQSFHAPYEAPWVRPAVVQHCSSTAVVARDKRHLGGPRVVQADLQRDDAGTGF